MSIFAKVAIALALALPITAYVVGTLVAADPAPARHDPIVLEVGSTSSPSPDPSGSPGGASEEPSPGGPASSRPAPSAPAGGQEPEVVTADPVDPRDDGRRGADDRDDDGDDDRDDDRDDDGDDDGEADDDD